MKKTLHISASFDQPQFVQNLVEQLAYRRYDLGYSRQQMPPGFKALETSTTETYVSGTMAIDSEKNMEHFDMPFITCFLFTCVKGKTDPYQLIWSSSLS
jgi:glucose-6-phosphate 1-dehydrogenase